MDAAPLPVGKPSSAVLQRLLARACGQDPSVLLGAALGEDAAALDPDGRVVVAAADPVTLTGSDAGRLVVAINANDVAVTGARPRWFLLTALLPEGTTEAALTAQMDELRAALDALGATLVGGHTEVTPAVAEPVLVGHMLGTVEHGPPVATAGLSPGDVVVQVGPAPVEGAAVLAAEHPEALAAAGVDPATARGALDDPGVVVVEAALVAAAHRATAMHDPTEGGLAGGLHELATAAGVGLEVDGSAIAWFAPGVAACEAVGADPWATLASGCLLVGAAPDDADALLSALAAAGHPGREIGRAVVGQQVRVDGRPLPWPERDEVARLA